MIHLRVKRVLAIFLLMTIYGFTMLVAWLGDIWRKRIQKRYYRILVCVTIDNPNWFKSHIEPITRSNYGEIILVCDEPQDVLPNLRYACPPFWLRRFVGRAGSKMIWAFFQGVKYPSDLFMGYHIFPCGIIALLCAKLLGTRAAYQVTSGITEIDGGGYGAENRLLSAIGYSSPIVEKMAKKVIRKFDLVIVRGSSVKAYIRECGYANRLEILTGSVFPHEDQIQRKRDIDVVFVGRLVEIKQLSTLLDSVFLLLKDHPNIKVNIIGEGAERDFLEQKSQLNGCADNILFLGKRRDVSSILGRAKVFVLTSRSESVSIAMLEAMSMQAVPIVTKVGDLADFVIEDETGYLLEVGDAIGFAHKISEMLADEEKCRILGERAQSVVINRCSSSQIEEYWTRLLNSL